MIWGTGNAHATLGNQCVYLSDTTFITISVRLDKTSSDITGLARAKLRCANSNEECFLIEVKSSGERVVYAPTEVGVPTMCSLNGKLYVVFKDEIDSLVSFWGKLTKKNV